LQAPDTATPDQTTLVGEQPRHANTALGFFLYRLHATAAFSFTTKGTMLHFATFRIKLLNLLAKTPLCFARRAVHAHNYADWFAKRRH
jgi:hypothetical protein